MMQLDLHHSCGMIQIYIPQPRLYVNGTLFNKFERVYGEKKCFTKKKNHVKLIMHRFNTCCKKLLQRHNLFIFKIIFGLSKMFAPGITEEAIIIEMCVMDSPIDTLDYLVVSTDHNTWW